MKLLIKILAHELKFNVNIMSICRQFDFIYSQDTYMPIFFSTNIQVTLV